ncbi:hypothetical protein [Clostridium paraputrificum]|uniref:hypothetical protein n=1 Tax=Clostridium paraputrificum TaxID=29363 RepID=UPI000C08AD2E|nr:hypothetical protein [Clostridium paraputrificum]
MSNIDLVHAAYVQRKVQEAERRRWSDVIKEEIEKIKGYEESDQTIPSNHIKNNQEQYTTRERFRQTIKSL